MIFLLIAAAIIGLFVVNWLMMLNAEPGTDKHTERSIATYLTGGFILFWIVWFWRLCFDWTDHVPDDQFYAVRNHRIFTTLLYVIVIMMVPRIIRGTRRIWGRNRTRPPISWWCALPYGCGWGLLMTVFLFSGPFMDPPHDWAVVWVGLTLVWGFLALFHGFNACMNWLDRRKKQDVSFLE